MGQLLTQWCCRRPGSSSLAIMNFTWWWLPSWSPKTAVAPGSTSPAGTTELEGDDPPSVSSQSSSWHFLCSHHEVWVLCQLLHRTVSQEIEGPLTKKFINQEFFVTWQWSQQPLHGRRESGCRVILTGTMTISFHFHHIRTTTLKSPSNHYALKRSLQKQLALCSTGPSPA